MTRSCIPQPTRIESAARVCTAWTGDPGRLWHPKKPLPYGLVGALTSFAVALIFIAVASLIAGLWR